MDAVAPSDFTLYVERLVEPYTGMPLLGVGGYAPSADGTIEVRYDCETAVTLVPALVGDRFHFATQLPLEPATRVQVVAIGSAEHTLFDEPLATISDRATPMVEPRSLIARLLGIGSRCWRSAVTGELFSPRHWKARFSRLYEFLRKVLHKIRYKLLHRKFRPRSPYDAFVERTTLAPSHREALLDDARRFRYRPTISILMPVYNVRADWFREAVDSVRVQIYDNWELCIGDDASTEPTLIAEFAKLGNDPRIKLQRRTANGHICAATNTAADRATGEWIALLDHDDCLAPEALLEMVRALQSQPDTDLLYSDEDKITAAGKRYDPQFKPDWSPELLLSYNYANHLVLIRRKLFESVGRYRLGYEGSQDHDLLLRITEKTDRIVHVPKVLYRWRAHANSTAERATQKSIVHTAGRRAVADALARRGVQAELYVPTFAAKLGLPILALDGPDTGPSVAIIVYGRDAGASVRAVKACTSYRNFTVYLVLDEGNLADALNRMAAARTEEILLFLQAGTVPNEPRWLARMVVHLQLPDVAVAGGLIRDDAGAIVSAGTLTNLHDGTAPGNACRGLAADAISYYFYGEVTRNVSATGAGCLLTLRRAFDAVGGFDADRFPRTLFDVDYCTRIRGLGRRCVQVAGAEFRAAANADRNDDPLELQALLHAHGRTADPYSNPHFSESVAFQPSGDGAVSLPQANRAQLELLAVAHNLNSPEGAPRYLSEIVLGLRDRRSVLPVVWSPSGGAGEKVYTSAGVPVTVADAPWSRRFIDGHWTRAEYDAAQYELRNQLKMQMPRVVVANTLLTFPAVEAAARLGIPCVWIIHESYSPDVLSRLFPPFARGRIEAAFALATRVVPASHDTAKLFEHWNTRGNFRVLHNGIPAAGMHPVPRLPNAKKRLLSVGTVCERKGQHTLVEAAAILAKTRSDFVVDIVGLREGVPYAGYVRELVSRRKLQGIVNLVSEVPDVKSALQNADVFVCTSHMETFSRAILEAEAFGLPIVSTPCHGLSEQVKWGWNALQFQPNDAAGLAEQLHRLLEDEPLRAKMASRSRALFESHLSYSEMLDRYDLVIRSAVGQVAFRATVSTAAVRRTAA